MIDLLSAGVVMLRSLQAVELVCQNLNADPHQPRSFAILHAVNGSL